MKVRAIIELENETNHVQKRTILEVEYSEKQIVLQKIIPIEEMSIIEIKTLFTLFKRTLHVL